MIEFKELSINDIPQMHEWFNQPHVQRFYSLRNWSQEEVRQKLSPYIMRQKPVSGYMIYLENRPIGYIQSYRVSDFPWDNQNLSKEIVEQAAGFDLFIGEEDLIGKGLGSQIIQQFLQEMIWPEFTYCIVDPSSENIRAIRCYQNLGFKYLKTIITKDALNQSTKLKLLINVRK